MREIGIPFLSLGLLMVGLFSLGLGVGWRLAQSAHDHALAVLARLQRTGNPEAPAAPDVSSELRAPNAEAAANARVMKDAIEKGADQLQAEAKAHGMPMSRKQARDDAAAMLNQPPLGGAQ